MLYLFWAIINVCAFFYFFYLLIVGGKLIRQKVGFWACVVFVFGLLSFVGRSNNHNDNMQPGTNQYKKWSFTPEDSLVKYQTFSRDFTLDENLISKYTLAYRFGKDKHNNRYTPIEALSITSGWAVGTTWTPDDILIEPTEKNDDLKYDIHGTVKWNLLGITLFTQYKTYKGFIHI